MSTGLALTDRVAIVTGAGGGLGASHARLLAGRGAKVVVNDLAGAQAVAEEIIAYGGGAVADDHSVTTPEGGAAIVQTALDAFGRVDILVNNAGVIRDRMFHKLTDDLIETVLAVHLAGAFNVTRPAYAVMRAQGYGRIVTTTSASGLFGNAGQANYAAAKMGLVGLAKTVALEGARCGVTSNLVAPVAFTPMTAHLLDADDVSRIGPELVSPVVAYLASEDCPVTGEILSVGGGRVARVFIATTPGFSSAHPTVEEVAAHWEQVMAEDSYVVPTSCVDELVQLHGADLHPR